MKKQKLLTIDRLRKVLHWMVRRGWVQKYGPISTNELERRRRAAAGQL